MILGVAVLLVCVGLAYYVGSVRARREEARWWTGAVYAAGPGKLEQLQAYIASRNPRSSEPHDCAEELARHLVLPHVSDGGRPIVLPTDWAAAEDVVPKAVRDARAGGAAKA